VKVFGKCIFGLNDDEQGFFDRFNGILSLGKEKE